MNLPISQSSLKLFQGVFIFEHEFEVIDQLKKNLNQDLNLNKDILLDQGHVVALMLDSRKLTMFPLEVLKFPYLEILDLTNNKIERIPDEISNCAKLRILLIVEKFAIFNWISKKNPKT
jgi:Leucine-rich repeat (LRR) protein